MEEILNQTGRDSSQLRKQMVSLGKQPKAAPGRKKRDMVTILFRKREVVLNFLSIN